jgi:hypothetical protein
VYSAVGDLLLGDLVTHSALDKAQFVKDAFDEMNSMLGTVFEIPIDVTASSPIPEHARLLLKRINNHLATGRLILAVAIGGEDGSLHAYGLYLVREAYARIREILENPQAYLPDAVLRDDILLDTGPTIAHQDAESAVSAFYGTFMGRSFPAINPPWIPESGQS